MITLTTKAVGLRPYRGIMVSIITAIAEHNPGVQIIGLNHIFNHPSWQTAPALARRPKFFITTTLTIRTGKPPLEPSELVHY